jgi:DNA-binding LytR/AlgR family response regulator
MVVLDCIVVDDEPIAREIVMNYIGEVPYLKLVASCKEAFEAMEVLKEKHIDLLILDINMPRLSGLSMLRTLKATPDIIITSAYSEYALEGFELSVNDYLLKPFSFERFVQATEKVIKKRQKEISSPNNASDTKMYLFVKSDKRHIKIAVSQIRYIEAYGNYVNIYLEDTRIITKQTLSEIESLLSFKAFVRIHKSYIVSFHYIKYFEGNQISVGEKLLPIGKVYRDNLLKMLDNVRRDLNIT